MDAQSERGTIVGEGVAEGGPGPKMMTIGDFIAPLAHVTHSMSEDIIQDDVLIDIISKAG